MQYLALAADGDGTLTRGGKLSHSTLAALKRWRAAGRKLLLVTGERPQELCKFPHLELFDSTVAENGALLVACQTRKEKRLTKQPPAKLITALKKAGVRPLKIGRATIETKTSQQTAVQGVLGRLKIGWVVARNRDDLMVVPRGVTKATGLAAALADERISPHRVVAIGDGENDAPLLDYCGLGVAVANAVPALRKHADVVTSGQYGKGVVETIDRLLATDWMDSAIGSETTARRS
jgi:hydroxymethylpyrimidine pyrophosphatase-like HAD family hydrolase